MTRKLLAIIIAALGFACPGLAQEPMWTKKMMDRAKRDALHGSAHPVRGDSGKWSDDACLVAGQTLQKVPNPRGLDPWIDGLLKQPDKMSTASNTWLLFRSEQLDDNDRLWIEAIERKGKVFTVVAARAKWHGKYFRNFTYYQILAVDLGKLESGEYEARWILQPRVFTRFEGDGKAMNNWPRDDRPAEKKKATELRTTFRILEGL